MDQSFGPNLGFWDGDVLKIILGYHDKLFTKVLYQRQPYKRHNELV